MRIPKTIIQTARSYDALPGEIKRNIEDLKARNPDWTYRFFGDDEMKSYLRTHLKPEEWELLQEVNPKYGVVLADVFRYLFVYREGGVYLDVKSTATRPLTDTIDPDIAFVISQWPNKVGQIYIGYGLHPELADVPGGEFQQWNVIAEPRHPYLKAVLERVFRNLRDYTPALFGTDAYGVLRVSGPIAYTLAIYPLLDHYPHKIVDLERWGVLYSIYDANNAAAQSHQARMPGHYATVREPIVVRDLYVEPQKANITKLGDLLSRELRDNIDLVLKLAVFSMASTATLIVALLVAVIVMVVR